MEGSQQSAPHATDAGRRGGDPGEPLTPAHVWGAVTRLLNKLYDIGDTLHQTLAEELDADRTRRARLAAREAELAVDREAPR